MAESTESVSVTTNGVTTVRERTITGGDIAVTVQVDLGTTSRSDGGGAPTTYTRTIGVVTKIPHPVRIA